MFNYFDLNAFFIICSGFFFLEIHLHSIPSSGIYSLKTLDKLNKKQMKN